MMKELAAEQDERVLLLEARAGSRTAVEALYRIYDGRLRRIAWRYRDVSFEDALQEARLAFLLCIQSYDFGRGVDFGAYVWRKVRGDVRSRMRRLWTVADRNVYADAPMDGDGAGSRWDLLVGGGVGASGGGAGAGGACGSGGGAGLARSAIGAGLARGAVGAADLAWELAVLLDDAGLSPRERFAVEAGLMGYTLAEVARAEGVSLETVKTWRKRAYAKLRRCTRDG